jgi:hypothetical protein
MSAQVASKIRKPSSPGKGGGGEPGQVGRHGQSQRVNERRWIIGGNGRQVCEGHHAQTLRPPWPLPGLERARCGIIMRLLGGVLTAH